jgi:hypothetical protein
MWSQRRPLRPLRPHRPSEAQQEIQKLIHEHDEWLGRLVAKYGLPRAALLKMLDRPGALEDEIVAWIVDHAVDRARELFATDQPAPPLGPDNDDLYSRAVRGVHATLTARRAAQEAAEQAKRYAETDAFLARMKAGEEL